MEEPKEFDMRSVIHKVCGWDSKNITSNMFKAKRLKALMRPTL